MPFDIHQILNLVGQMGGNHQQAAQQFAGINQIDPQQHSGLLQQNGIDPQQLANGGYDQHLQTQNDPGFGGYQPGGDPSQQQPDFSGYQQGGGYSDQGGADQQGGGYRQGGGYSDQGGADQQGGGYSDQGGQDPNQQSNW